jgi:hypothetical protein
MMRDCAQAPANPKILRGKRALPKKCHLPEKNPLRRPVPLRKYPLTERRRRQTVTKTETNEAGRAKEDTAHSVNFVSPLFEIAGN